MSDLYHIGEKIKEIRKKKKISQEKLAELTEMNFRTISRIETSRNIPNLETLEKIASTLDVNISDFFDSTASKSRENMIKEIEVIINNLTNKDLRNLYKILHDLYN